MAITNPAFCFILHLTGVHFVAIANPAFCFALYLTGIHFRGELGDASELKIKCGPIRTWEIGSVGL